MKRIAEFYQAWHYLHDHPIFIDQNEDSRFHQELHVMVVKVNPETEEYDDNVKKNTVTRIWLETGPITAPMMCPKKAALIIPAGKTASVRTI